MAAAAVLAKQMKVWAMVVVTASGEVSPEKKRKKKIKEIKKKEIFFKKIPKFLFYYNQVPLHGCQVNFLTEGH